MFRFLATVVAVSHTAAGFYLPGVAPQNYEDGDRVELKVNKLRYA